MASDNPVSGGPAGTTPDPLIFVSDATAEAERLTASLRGRGYWVVDVPLGLLLSRASVQRPAVVLCDADAPGALEVVERLREVPGASAISVLFLGEPGLEGRNQRFAREAKAVFARPVDVHALLRRIESLIGQPGPRGLRLAAPPAGSRAPVLVASTRRPYRYETRSDASDPASSPFAIQSAAPPPSSHPPESIRAMPQSRLSSDLENLLGEAEQRVGDSRPSVAAPSERLTPEAEIEAVLPQDLLAALDEPLDELDDDDDDGSGTPGRGSSASGSASRSGSKAGHDASAGTSPGGSVNPFAKHEPAAADEEREPRSPSVTPPSLEMPRPTPPPRPRSAPPVASQTGVDRRSSMAPPMSYTVAEPAPSDKSPLSSPSEPPPTPANRPTTSPPRPSDEPPLAMTPVPARSAPLPLPPGTPQLLPSEPKVAPASAPATSSEIEIPHSLRPGDALRILARAVRARYAGAMAFEDAGGIRRVVFRDGDFVTASTGIEAESLVALLQQRGDLSPQIAARLGRKLPQFGRHAGAALIAQGHLKQDDLWPVLRAHAEWLLTGIARLERGAASLEPTIPPRLAAEPSVFGGATGAEVLIEIVRRAVPPAEAIRRLGGLEARLSAGPSQGLASECALSDAEMELVSSAAGGTLEDLVRRAGTDDFATVLLALVELGVLSSRGDRAPERSVPSRALDAVDLDAVRGKLRARRALVDEGDYFSLLGISRGATSYDIHRAYTTLRQELDPSTVLTPANADLGDDLELVLDAVDEAYEILRDQVRRERYRRALEESP